MFHVLHPLGLLALGALAAPILIHLRHRPRPVVRVGSLRPFLAHPTASRSRTLHRWPMLLLRCAILAALVLALAGLEWLPTRGTPSRWCLLVPGTLLDDSHRRDWKRLLDDGFEPRWLAPNFPPIEDLAVFPTPNLNSDAWSLLNQADRQLAPGSQAWVFGPTWAEQFQGVRPTLHRLKAQWHEVPMAFPSPPVPPAPRVALVHAPDRNLDAQYLRAALTAIGVPIVSNQVPSWIFQLGSAPLPPAGAEARNQGAHLVRDASDSSEPEIVSRSIEVDTQTVRLRQRVAPGPGNPLFRDSHGDPWLTEENGASGVTWHFAFRFHPDWTDWPLDGAFPAWWRNRLQPPSFNPALIAPEQATPRFDPNPTPSASLSSRPPAIDLRSGCWMLGVILFLVERVLGGKGG